MTEKNKTPEDEGQSLTEIITPENIWKRSWRFTKELWNDHEFWLRTFAVKGGASAVVVAGMLGISYFVALPFMVATLGVALCGGLVAMGLSGIFLGATKGWDNIRSIWAKTISGKPLKKDDTPLKPARQQLVNFLHLKALTDKPFVKKIINSSIIQKIVNSPTWKRANKIARRQEDIFLAGLAMKGSILSAGVGAAILTTQVLVLSTITVGGLVTLPTVAAAGGILSGIYGIYLSGESLIKSIRKKTTMAKAIKKKKLEKKEKQEQRKLKKKEPTEKKPEEQALESAKIKETFTEKSMQDKQCAASKNKQPKSAPTPPGP